MEPPVPNKDDFTIEPPSRWTPWLGSCLAAVIVLGVSVALMQRMGLFEVTATDAGAKSIAASFALLGSVFTASVTLVGVMLKYSIDDRATTIARVEANRSYKLATEEAFRSRVDVALRAVDLLGENNEDASKAQMGGSLLALSTLGEFELAVALLTQLWPDGRVASPTAEVVLVGAFSKGSPTVQKDAATLLFSNSNLLSLGDSHIWPFTDPMWPLQLPELTRSILAETAAEWLLDSIRRSETLRDFTPVTILYDALDDPSQDVRTTAYWSLMPVANAWPSVDIELCDRSGSFGVDDLKNKLGKANVADRVSTRIFQRSEQIAEAVRSTRGEPESAGVENFRELGSDY